ncbi:MAG: hypothetical protein IJC83_04370, partial [Oscillospiraceae bacterium]|nr:hypothetical protein [Oscillospiraceae bacterium]
MKTQIALCFLMAVMILVLPISAVLAKSGSLKSDLISNSNQEASKPTTSSSTEQNDTSSAIVLED